MMLTIVSPEKTLYSGEAESVLVPATQGQFEILQNHAAIISSLQSGEVVYRTAEGEQRQEIQGGFVEVNHNQISICVETK